MAISAIVAVGGAADPLLSAIEARIAELRVGPGTAPDSQMGPLVTRQHRDRGASYLDRAPAHGADVVVDGRPLASISGSRRHARWRGHGSAVAGAAQGAGSITVRCQRPRLAVNSSSPRRARLVG
jgi:hypothetical protein